MTRETVLKTDCYSLSPLQRGLLFHHFEASNSGDYIQQVVLTLPESLHASALREAWQEVLDRHSALRTTFLWQTTAPPLQQVHPNVFLPWQEYECSDLTAKQQEEKLSAFLAFERERGFDITEPPLMRVALFRFGKEDFRLVWTFHHILIDGR